GDRSSLRGPGPIADSCRSGGRRAQSPCGTRLLSAAPAILLTLHALTEAPSPMLAKRIVPLIVAVALFMENMDSTVIATSLPAIAADIGTSPLALKLAVTSYLLSLAVFIPVSGWTADRDEDGERKEVGGDRELERQRAGADIGRNRGQRGGDHGRVHVFHEQGDRHDQRHDAFGGHW